MHAETGCTHTPQSQAERLLSQLPLKANGFRAPPAGLFGFSGRKGLF